MAARRAAAVWVGPDGLRPLLVPIAELHAHPRNPRRGDVAKLTASLSRFGQVRAILAQPDGSITAGNHTWLAAREMGWSHIACVRAEMSAADARAYLLADNRLADVAGYENEQLAELLAELAEEEAGFDGTGWDAGDLDKLLRELQGDRDFAEEAAREWRGMPEHENEDLAGAVQQVTVRFLTHTDRDRFAAMIGQTITDDTRYLWYPPLEVDTRSAVYLADAEG